MPYDNRGRDWHAASPQEGLPRILSNHQKPGRRQDEFSPRTFREGVILPTPRFGTSRLQNWEEINLRCLKPPSLWEFVVAGLRN